MHRPYARDVERACEVEGCARSYHARGRCRPHWEELPKVRGVERQEKRCSKCEQTLPISGFHQGQSYCKPCQRAYTRARPSDHPVRERARRRAREWATIHPEAIRENKRRWQSADPTRAARVARAKKLRQKYGLTIAAYDEMLTQQNGRCAICGSSQSIADRALVVDHCHATGTVRGLLCDWCNRALGSLRDDPAVAERAADYLRRAAGR